MIPSPEEFEVLKEKNRKAFEKAFKEFCEDYKKGL